MTASLTGETLLEVLGIGRVLFPCQSRYYQIAEEFICAILPQMRIIFIARKNY